MDWVGNAPHGVRLPYNYLARSEWAATYANLGLEIDAVEEDLDLYPAPVSLIFGHGLHFVVRLSRIGSKQS
jgi:hypothetical protein